MNDNASIILSGEDCDPATGKKRVLFDWKGRTFVVVSILDLSLHQKHFGATVMWTGLACTLTVDTTAKQVSVTVIRILRVFDDLVPTCRPQTALDRKTFLRRRGRKS
ncbi:hypothetical protein AVEN_13942-1 [Araneus ventricosus]|uniref:Uncharacterized protein n=1 Tax=Araneus ventricosus TaxID=182803 RepID=A0A4Y2BFW3_ARAVE|nr:hypothetical protein AVEN_13942-1 [Araneus ventricosus]